MTPLSLTRIRRPDPQVLVHLAAYDREAFGPTGLRTYDLAVTAEAGAVYTAHSATEMVGAFQLLRILDEPSFLYVLGFYVLPEWRGRGWGHMLLEAMLGECRRLDAEGVVLTVSPHNQAALGLYRAAGFSEEGSLADFYGKGEDRLVLRKRFEGPKLPGSVS